MIDGKRAEFSSLPALWAHVEARWIIDPSDYTSPLLGCGDIYRADPYGAYDITSGELVVPFDGSCFWRDKKDRKHYINTHDDMESAEGDIVDRYNRKRLLYRDINRFRYEFVRPERLRARDAVTAIIADGFSDILDVIVPKQLPRIRDVIDVDYNFPGSRVGDAIRKVRDRAIVDFRDHMEDRDWHEFNLRLNNTGDIIVEMGMDTRIRFFYEYHIRKEVEREMQED